jgi:LysM repeat protein
MRFMTETARIQHEFLTPSTQLQPLHTNLATAPHPLLAAPAAPAAASCSGQQYTVASGDTCDSIAAAAGMPVDLLQYADAGTLDCSQLRVGADVCLFGTTPSCPMVYQVKAGDTCVSVAAAMGLTSEQFYSLNPGASCSGLQPGSELCVSSVAGMRAAEPDYQPVTDSEATLPAQVHGIWRHSVTLMLATSSSCVHVAMHGHPGCRALFE